MSSKNRKYLTVVATACLTIGVAIGIVKKSPQVILASLLIAAIAYGVALLMDWFRSARSDWKAGRFFEALFGTAIYAGVVYFIYTFLKLLLTGK